MRHLTLMAFAALALAGCNGGEDFSDATVPGCPLGATCNINPRGESLVELQGPRVANLGYRCGSSNGFTRGSETTIGDIEVPAYHALCPASSRSIEFYIGNGVFEGNRVTLGEYVFPLEQRKELYQVTIADLLDPPRRLAVQEGQLGTASSVLNRSALLHALNEQGNDSDEAIIIPGEPDENGDDGDPNTIIDAQPQLIPADGFAYSDYAAFKDAWQGLIDNVNASQLYNVDGFDPSSTEPYQENVEFGNDRTRSGLYALSVSEECILQGVELEACDYGGAPGTNISLSLNALVLPDGQILGGGLGLRATSQEDSTFDYVGFRSNASLSDLLEFQEQGAPSNLFVGLLGRGIGDANELDTVADLSGRFLASGLYSGVTVEGRSDFNLDFPSGVEPLADSEKGKVTGTLLTQNLADNAPLPFRASKTAVVQARPDGSIVSDLVGVYTLRLMRACVGEDDDDAVCSEIPSPDDDSPEENEEVTPVSCDRNGKNCFVAGNYQQTGEGPTDERIRLDEGLGPDGPVGEFCLSVKSNGFIEVGTWNQAKDSCQLSNHDVGFVTRTFETPRSANVSLMLAPGLDVRSAIPHYNTAIEGRIDLREEAEECAPMYRLGDENFEIGLRAKWVEQSYLPLIMREETFQDPPTELEGKVFNSLTVGAVQFFKGAPGDQNCDPMAP